ncbi:MAG: hypothetical protein JO276_04275 [Sphingomonadaceae bacterium]|nr:hypothetical protein [Sphingomonadaceae bacterium]
MSEGPGAGEILAGIFVTLCGLFLTLLGGGCTFFWLAAMLGGGDGLRGNYELGIPLLLVSLAAFAGGAALLWAAGKMAFGKN